MVKSTVLSELVNGPEFLSEAIRATTVDDVENLLSRLPITSQDEYVFDEENPCEKWCEGNLHWIPVGKERGNAGRIKQANQPVNPIAERAINGMEALIELYRQREMLNDPSSPPPVSPRDAVRRYFSIPPLDELPKLDKSEESKLTRERARELARQVRVRLISDKTRKKFTVSIEDDGIGQSPERVHKTLLSLGSTTKADKWYLIGVFGQGGSSAYAVSEYSWLISKRAPDLLNGDTDGISWTVIKHVFPVDRRDDYFAYLAASPDGRVPFLHSSDVGQLNINHGTRFIHVGYDFGKGGSAINRQLYPALNHVLYNPVLPLDLFVGTTAATVYGNGYRLSSRGTTSATDAPVLDKIFPNQIVGI
jgi:hypothetical protein